MTCETGHNRAMGEITIRPARPADARGIARIDVETWRTTYAGVLPAPYLVGLSVRRREAGWRSVILREPRDMRVAVDALGTVLGFGSCGPNRGDRNFSGEIFTLYVAPDWQNQGIGRRLLIGLFRRLVASGRSSAILWVVRDNPSRFFYERLGGQQVSHKALAVGGAAIELTGYGWRDLPGFLAAVPSEDSEPEP
jgi:ribosomal protein S18 acetylase RimI-like enzyme